MITVAGKAIVVTGGAGHLGSAICAALANDRADVLCLSSRAGRFDGMLGPQSGRIESTECNVGDEDAVIDHVARFASRSGRIHGLVNCATRSPRGIDLDMPLQEFSATQVNQAQYFSCGRIAAGYMDKGSIVNLASMWGFLAAQEKMYLGMGNGPSLAQSASAGAILSLTRAMAGALAAKSIRVNAVVPGFCPKKRGPDRPDYMAEITSRVPLGRIGTPADITGAVMFLLSDASSYMTGQSIVIDGGYSLQ